MFRMKRDDSIVVLTEVDANFYRKGKATGRYRLERTELIDDMEETKMVLHMQGYRANRVR